MSYWCHGPGSISADEPDLKQLEGQRVWAGCLVPWALEESETFLWQEGDSSL